MREPTPLRIAGAVGRCWVRLYTAGLRRDVRARRIHEIESDLWEHGSDACRRGLPAGRAAWSLVDRILRGVLDDVRWSAGEAWARPQPRPRRWIGWVLCHAVPVYMALTVGALVGALPRWGTLPAGFTVATFLVGAGSASLGLWLLPRRPRWGWVAGIPALVLLLDVAQYLTYAVTGLG